MSAALGIRLGVPKPGVRMAPSELLESVLGVGYSLSHLFHAGVIPSMAT